MPAATKKNGEYFRAGFFAALGVACAWIVIVATAYLIVKGAHH